jgi:uncharacterized membrane protein
VRILPTEHFHPLLVHFPIALWSTGGLLLLLSYRSRFYGWRDAAVLMGIVGTAFGFGVIKTGELAAGIVSRNLCNLSTLNLHEEQAWTAFNFFGATFIAAAVLQIVYRRFAPEREFAWIFRMGLALGIGLGSVFLVLAGHKGFQLVYEQGAGVHPPGDRCPEPARPSAAEPPPPPPAPAPESEDDEDAKAPPAEGV